MSILEVKRHNFGLAKITYSGPKCYNQSPIWAGTEQFWQWKNSSLLIFIVKLSQCSNGKHAGRTVTRTKRAGGTKRQDDHLKSAYVYVPATYSAL
jgi:hypothetical protein